METHILFFILAGLLIAILVGYSLWSARREKSRVFSNTFSTRPPAKSTNSDLPINNTSPILNSGGLNHSHKVTLPQQEEIEAQQQEFAKDVERIKIRLPDQDDSSSSHNIEPTVTPQVQESMFESQMAPLENPEEEITEVDPSVTEQEPAQNIVLYVVAPEGTEFQGEMIAYCLDSLGFHFGEHRIFHRHLDNSASPILFSVANMVQPGIFDITQMDNFSTVGLVFFMPLPSATGNDVVNLRLMIDTVESFAQSMGGFVLDEQQQLFNDETRRQYLLRVAK